MVITENIFEKVLESVECSDVGLDTTLKTIGVDRRDWCKFLAAAPELTARYARAKQAQIERSIDNMHLVELEGMQAIQACDPKIANAMASMYKLKVDNLRWIASKLAPKIYGDKIAVDLDNTLNISISSKDGKSLSI
jgi:hypothetical protein